MLKFPVHTRNFRTSCTTVAVAPPKEVGVGRNESVPISRNSINKYWRAKRAEEAFIRGIFVAAVFEPEHLHPASAVRSRGQLHSVNQYAAALLGGERVRADSNAARRSEERRVGKGGRSGGVAG